MNRMKTAAMTRARARSLTQTSAERISKSLRISGDTIHYTEPGIAGNCPPDFGRSFETGSGLLYYGIEWGQGGLAGEAARHVPEPGLEPAPIFVLGVESSDGGAQTI